MRYVRRLRSELPRHAKMAGTLISRVSNSPKISALIQHSLLCNHDINISKGVQADQWVREKFPDKRNRKFCMDSRFTFNILELAVWFLSANIDDVKYRLSDKITTVKVYNVRWWSNYFKLFNVMKPKLARQKENDYENSFVYIRHLKIKIEKPLQVDCQSSLKL